MNDELEQVTDFDNLIAILPIVLLTVLLGTVVSFFMGLFGYTANKDKSKTLRKQQREYMKMERRIRRELY